MAKSYYLDNAVLNVVLNSSAYTSPSQIQVGLFNVSPGPGGGGQEVTDASYSRQAVTFGSPANGVVANNATVTFPPAINAWGSIVAFGLFDQGGNLLYYGALLASKVINSGDQLTFAVGGITVTET